MNAKDVKDVRITDPYIKGLIAREQARRGIKTAARTAGILLLEHIGEKDRRDHYAEIYAAGVAGRPEHHAPDEAVCEQAAS